MEPLADTGPPGRRRVAEPIARLEGVIDFLTNAVFGLIDLINETVEVAIFGWGLSEVAKGEEVLNLLAEFAEVFFASGSNDEFGVGDEFLEFLVNDIGGFIRAADDERGAVAKNLFGSRSGEAEGLSGARRALANTQGIGVDGLEEVELGLREKGGDALGIPDQFVMLGVVIDFSEEGFERWGVVIFRESAKLLHFGKESRDVAGTSREDERGGGEDLQLGAFRGLANVG